MAWLRVKAGPRVPTWAVVPGTAVVGVAVVGVAVVGAAIVSAVVYGAAAAVAPAGGAAPLPRLAQFEASLLDAESHRAIAYGAAQTSDQIVELGLDLRAGRARLPFDERLGYLPALLRALRIPAESQLAVFSKTSLQSPVIGPKTPRTIFFNDRTIVAWPEGGFIEIAAQGARQGVAFYLLDQRAGASDAPPITRGPACLTCHRGFATLNVPGLLVRSVGTLASGATAPQAWNSTTTHASPFAERWAGWYVTGRSGPLAHLGNAIVTTTSAGDTVTPRPSSLASLGERLDTSRYVAPYSDIAALLVFDHQMHAMNLLTRAGWDARIAAADQAPDTPAILEAAASALVDYLLFVGEAPLSPGIESTSGFAEAFAREGPRDRLGRSLRQLDLRTRLMRYPCSYMIYAEAFEGLPADLKEAIYRRL
jgi:hypothetical protein